jgi:hypothetical protein
MKKQSCIVGFLLFLYGCRDYKYRNQMFPCDCTFEAVTKQGIYEESYLQPKGDTRFWLEKVVLITDSGTYGYGATDCIDHCGSLRKWFPEDRKATFYGESFYPKGPSEVVATTNLFYNADSSKVIIAFKIKATLLKLAKTKKREKCLKWLNTKYYSYAYDQTDLLKNEPFGWVTGVFVDTLSRAELKQKQYSKASDAKPFSYWTGH